MVKETLQRINRTLESPSFNLIIHSAPFRRPRGRVPLARRDHADADRTAGFEWGTGFYINPTSPEEATEVLRHARLSGRS